MRVAVVAQQHVHPGHGPEVAVAAIGCRVVVRGAPRIGERACRERGRLLHGGSRGREAFFHSERCVLNVACGRLDAARIHFDFRAAAVLAFELVELAQSLFHGFLALAPVGCGLSQCLFNLFHGGHLARLLRIHLRIGQFKHKVSHLRNVIHDAIARCVLDGGGPNVLRLIGQGLRACFGQNPARVALEFGFVGLPHLHDGIVRLAHGLGRRRGFVKFCLGVLVHVLAFGVALQGFVEILARLALVIFGVRHVAAHVGVDNRQEPRFGPPRLGLVVIVHEGRAGHDGLLLPLLNLGVQLRVEVGIAHVPRAVGGRLGGVLGLLGGVHHASGGGFTLAQFTRQTRALLNLVSGELLGVDKFFDFSLGVGMGGPQLFDVRLRQGFPPRVLGMGRHQACNHWSTGPVVFQRVAFAAPLLAFFLDARNAFLDGAQIRFVLIDKTCNALFRC